MTAETFAVTPGLARLREPADAAARSVALVGHAASAPAADGAVGVHDLGCGTGSMARWLAPLLPAPSDWVLHDRDADLLAVAVAIPATPTDAPQSQTRSDDITRLPDDELDDASLLTPPHFSTCSPDGAERFVGSLRACEVPRAHQLSVTGRVELVPAGPLDPRIQSPSTPTSAGASRRGLLGPDASTAPPRSSPTRPLRHRAQSPWHSRRTSAALISAWLTGWVGAAVEQDPDLAEAATAYLQRRLQELAAGRLHVTVHHEICWRCRNDRIRRTRRRAERRDCSGPRRPAAGSPTRVLAGRADLGDSRSSAVLFWRVGTGPFLDGIRQIDARAITAAVIIGAITTVCCAWRWSLVARGLGVSVPMRAAVPAYYRSQFLNVTLPGG